MSDTTKTGKPKTPGEAKTKDTYNPVNMAGKKAEIVSDDVDASIDGEHSKTVADEAPRNGAPVLPRKPKPAGR